MSSNYFNWDGPRTILNDINNVNASAKTYDFLGRAGPARGLSANPKPVPKKFGPLIFCPSPSIGPYFGTQTLTFSGRAAHDQV